MEYQIFEAVLVDIPARDMRRRCLVVFELSLQLPTCANRERAKQKKGEQSMTRSVAWLGNLIMVVLNRAEMAPQHGE